MYYILQFNRSAGFMACSLSNLVNNLSKRLHRIQWKLGHDDKKCKIFKLNISTAIVLLNTHILNEKWKIKGTIF